MKKVSVIAAAVAATLAAGSAFAVDFNGYMRAGTGISNNDGGDISFMKNGIGRLGNEDDNYSEFGFSEELKTGEQNWRIESMIASSNSGASGWQDGDFNVAQFNVQAKGLFASDKEAVLWAGKRYYQRKDIHITDTYFLDTSGTGGGIENVSIGNQFSFAVLQDGEDSDYAGYKVDARLAGISLWNDASLELAAVYNFATETANGNSEADDGVLATAIIHQNLSFGFNQTILQYGTASYGEQAYRLGGAGSYYDRSGAQDDANGFRFLNWGVVSLGQSWELGHQLGYTVGSDIGGTNSDGDYTGQQFDLSQFTAVVRPMYKWNDTMRTVFEAGYNSGDRIANGGLAKEDFGGAKFTVAQTWAMGDNFWARPELRIYASYLKDLESDSFGATETQAGEDNDVVVGIQVEAWW
ncbi:maltoporin LamB [Vibrio olivae]